MSCLRDEIVVIDVNMNGEMLGEVSVFQYLG